MDDSVDTIRDATAEALGTLMKIVSERLMVGYLEKLDKVKETKVREYFATAEVKCTLAAVKKPAPPPAKV